MIQPSIGVIAAVFGFTVAPLLRRVETTVAEFGLSLISDRVAESLPHPLGFFAIDIAYYHSLTFVVVVTCIACGFFDLRALCVALIAVSLGYAVHHLMWSAQVIFASDTATGYRFRIEVSASVSTVLAAAGGFWLGTWLRSPRFRLRHLLIATAFAAFLAATISSHTSWHASTGFPLMFSALAAALLWLPSTATNNGEQSDAPKDRWSAFPNGFSTPGPR